MLRGIAGLRELRCLGRPGRTLGRRPGLSAAGFLLGLLLMPLTLAGLAPPAGAEPGRPTITALKPIVVDVRVGRHPDKTRFVLEVTDILDYTLLPIADPFRIVIDLPVLDWQTGQANGPGVGLIERHRSGRFDAETTRIVLDLSGPAAIRDHFFLPAKDGHLPRFVLDLAPSSAARFGKTAGVAVASAGHRAPSAERRSAQTGPAATDRAAESKETPTLRPPSKPVRAEPAAAVAAAAAATGLASEPPTAPPVVPPRRPKRWIIVVDPGHGGVDPGAIGVGGVREKGITLRMARDLRTALHRTGRFKVILTRDDDRFLRLRERVEVARRAAADLFLSLHADSIELKNFRGVSIYTLSETASDREAEMLAAKENRADALAGLDLSREQDEVVSILIDLAQRDALNQARRFAQLVVDDMEGVAPLIPRPHRSAGFAVLTAPDVPSVLIELGYLTNKQDAMLLQRPAYRRKIAEALTESIRDFFRTVETAHRL